MRRATRQQMHVWYVCSLDEAADFKCTKFKSFYLLMETVFFNFLLMENKSFFLYFFLDKKYQKIICLHIYFSNALQFQEQTIYSNFISLALIKLLYCRFFCNELDSSSVLFSWMKCFLRSFVLTQKNQKVKKEKIYSTFLSLALIELL